MPHITPLIGTIVVGLSLAFVFALIAHRLGLSPLIGYVLAGVVVGPTTPGYVADQGLANELAEIGVILLMFGVGLHFSIRDLLAVRRIAVPGALAQIGTAVAMGAALSWWMGWSLGAGLVFGLALSVASTVVLLRALQARKIIDTERGRIAVGWLVVEDLVMVLALVMIPTLAMGGSGIELGWKLALTVGKVALFIALMLVVGRRLVPWLLHIVAHSGSRELFRLAVLAVALGVAGGATALFGVSFALGAFFAGMILAESPLSQRAAEETLPLRDAFAVLFFVSVGMLFDPAVIVEQTAALLMTLAIIIVGKSVAAFAIVRAFGHPARTALTVSASLAQIGEFSFILVALGTSLNVLPAAARDLVLAGAILSIMFNPLLFLLTDRVVGRFVKGDDPVIGGTAPAAQAGHMVLVGRGRVGSLVARQIGETQHRLTLIETQRDAGDGPLPANVELVVGNAAEPAVLKRAAIADARLLLVAIPDAFEAGQIVEQARKLNPQLRIVARAHRDAEVEHLEKRGADLAIMGEREIARRMIDQALIGA